MSLKDCAGDVRRAAGGGLNEREALDLLAQVADAAGGGAAGLDARARRLAETAGAKLAAERRATALRALKRDEVGRAARALMAQGMTADGALKALMHGTHKGVAGGRASAFRNVQAYEGRYLGGLMARITKEGGPDLEAKLKDRAFNERVVAEMEALDKDGLKSATGDADAFKVARIFAEAAETGRSDLNRLGADIGRLKGWTPHDAHDPHRVMKAGKAAWTRAIKAGLDVGRTFGDMDPAEVDLALGEIWTSIVTGRDREVTPAQKGERTGPAGYAKSLMHRRALHFKPGAWSAYNRDFGRGTVTMAMVDHLQNAARKAGVMETFGPNPEVLLQGLSSDLALELRNGADAGKRTREIRALGNVRNWASTKVMLRSEGAGNARFARAAAGFRALEGAAKLGGAILSALPTDPVVLAASARFRGKPFFETWREVISGYVQGRGQGEGRELAYLAGEGFDGLIDALGPRFDAHDTPAGWTTSALTAVFRLSGLTRFTDAGRAAASRIVMADLGSKADRPFAALPERLKNVLAANGIDAPRWAALRLAVEAGEDGRAHMRPDRVAGLADDDVAFLAGELPLEGGEAFDAARLDLELKLRGLIGDEVNNGIVEGDDATRVISTGGTGSGTAVGEAIRLVMQFKAFPIGFTDRVLNRRLRARGGALGKAVNMGELIATLWVGGMAAMWMKDLARGQTPKSILDGDGGLNEATLLAGLMQSGGLGLYGDFLLGAEARYGQSPLESLAGPGLGDVGGLARALLKFREGDADGAGDLVRTGMGLTPFANLWFARAGLDTLIVNSLKEALSPGYLDRQARRMDKDFGQERLLPPTLAEALE